MEQLMRVIKLVLLLSVFLSNTVLAGFYCADTSDDPVVTHPEFINRADCVNGGFRWLFNPDADDNGGMDEDVGGTNSTTFSGARTNLGVYSASETDTAIDGKISTHGGLPSAHFTHGTAAAIDVGTGANEVVQLDGTAKLPAVDGSQLLNLPGGSGAVDSVFNRTGAIEPQTGDYTPAQVGADPAGSSAVVQSNLDTHTGSTANPHNVTATQVGLGNVDNTTDANKPVSTAQQTALDTKANSADLGSAALLDAGLTIGDVIVVVDVGTCSDTQYTDQATCESNSGTWTAVAGINLTAINLPTAAGYQIAGVALTASAIGGASSIDGLSDADTTTSAPSIGDTLKWDGANWVPGIDNTAAGAGYVSTVPQYSDDACTAGQYSLSATTGYVCVSSGDWNTFSLTDWSNPSPTTNSLTITITDATGTNSLFTVNGDAATVADSPKTWAGLSSATQAVTFTPNSTEISSCTGTDVTGSDPNWVVDVSSADVTDMACTVSAGVVGAPADYYWELLDNAANKTILATSGGISGTAPANTDTMQTGTGFDLPTGEKLYVSSATIGGVFDAGSFTIQQTIKSVAVDPPGGSSTYLIENGTQLSLRLNFGAVDNVTLYVNGSSRGNTTYNFDDDATHVVRMIYDSTASTMALYDGATEENQTLVYTWTGIEQPTSTGTFHNFVVDWNGEVSDIKIWASAVTP